jgi:hypothetical protein
MFVRVQAPVREARALLGVGLPRLAAGKVKLRQSQAHDRAVSQTSIDTRNAGAFSNGIIEDWLTHD